MIRSSGVVIFSDWLAPRTAWTGTPRSSTSMASSVTAAAWPASNEAAASWARRRVARLEALRGLHGPQGLPGRGAGDELGGDRGAVAGGRFHCLDRVHDGHDRDDGQGAGREGVGHPVEDGLRRQGAGGVVDQDGFGGRQERSQRGADRLGAGGAAVDNGHDRELTGPPGGGRAPAFGLEVLGEGVTERVEFRIAGRNGDADLLRDAGRRDTPQGVGEDAVPAQRNLGFWHAVAQALAGAGRHDDDRGDGAISSVQSPCAQDYVPAPARIPLS